MTTLGEEYPKQQARCRVMLGHAKEIGPSGAFLVMLLEKALKEADEAAMSGDLARMISAFKEMESFQE